MQVMNDKLKVLREQFAAALPDKLQALRSQFEGLELTAWQPELALAFYRELHSLTGSAGTFGLPSVSAAARQLERRCKVVVEAGEAPDEEIWVAIGEELARIEQLTLRTLRTKAPSLMPPQNSARANQAPLIHLVDDDAGQAEHMAQALRGEGYQVRVFTAANDFRGTFAGDERPDAIILDMMFPEGDAVGAGLLAELKEHRDPCPPVVVVSVREDIEARLAAFRAGASRYLIKPVVPQALFDLLDALTGRIPVQPYRVLLVDDDPVLLEVQCVVLQAAGMSVQALTQPRAVIDTLDTFQPDVMVLDVYMPDISGPELAAIVRERDDYLGLPILFLSAETDMSQQLMALNMGGDDFLVKPVRPDHLVSAVTARARRARQNAAVQRRLQTMLYEREREHLALEQHAIVSVADAQGNIIYVNELFLQISGYSHDELLGQNHRIVKSDQHSAEFYLDLWRTISAGKVWQGDICNRRKDGSDYWVSSTITPFMNGDGRPYQYVSIRTDITELKAREKAQRAENAMRAVVGEVAAGLLAAAADTLDVAIELALGKVCGHIGADRAYLFLVTDDELHMSNTHEWCTPGIASQRDMLQDVSLEAIPWWWAQIRRDQAIIVPDVATLPPEASAEKAMFESLGLRALCGFPIRREGKTLGFFGFDQVTAIGGWDTSVLDLLSLMASQIGSALLRADAERVIQHQHRFTQDVLNSASANIAVLNRDGVIVAVNEPWRCFAAENAAQAGTPAPNSGVGTDYLAVCRQAEAADVPGSRAVGTGIESVMTGCAPSFRHEYPCHGPDKIRWFEMTVTPLSGDDGGVVISHASITERKLAEVELSKSAQRLHATLESTKDGILAVGEQGDVLFMNRQFREMWNMSEQLIQTTSDEQLLAHAATHIPDPEAFLEKVKALYCSDEESEDLVELTDGRIFERHSQSLKGSGYQSGRVWSFHDITARRRAEQAAEAAKERLRRGQVFANIGTWEWNIVTGELFWTERIAPLFGYADGQLDTSYDNFLAAVHPEDRQAVVDAVNACVEHDVPYEIEHRVVWPDGTVRWLMERGAVVRDAQGRPLQMLGVVQDVDDRKRAELALGEREQQLLQAQNLAAMGDWSADQLSSELIWSDEIYRIFGYQPGAVTPSIEFFRAAVHPDDITLLLEREREAEKTGQLDLIHRIIRPDGTIRYVHELARATLDDRGKLIRLTGTMQDVTEREDTERALQIFKHVVNSVLDGVLVIDTTGIVQVASPSITTIFGHAIKDVLNRNINLLMAEPYRSEHDSYLRHYLETGEERIINRQVEVMGRTVDGRDFPLEVAVSEIRIGQTRFFVGLLRDISTRKQAEESLIAARESAQRANQAKSEFLSSMSHELRTPMNAILGFGQLMEYDDTLPEEHQDSVKEILKAGAHLLELINEVLDLAKVESGKIELSLEPLALSPVVEECLALVGPLAAQHDVLLDYQGLSSAVVRADNTRLKQVILNLLSNAIKYNRAGGSVSVDVQPEGTERLRVRVTDTGRGIPQARLAELFQPFSRLDAENSPIEGTGIGLSITRRIVDMMGGKVDVHSEVGVGSTFWFELPCAELDERSSADSQTRSFNPVSPTDSDQLVLYIEDNRPNLKLVAQILERVPHVRLLSAPTPELGIELAMAHRPALILLDINLPGMDGYQVLEVFKMQATLKHTPVIAVTANAMPRDIERGMAAGFTDYLAKPLDVTLFQDMVKRYLAGDAE